MTRWLVFAVLAILAVHAIALYLMGQPLIYEGGYAKLWHGAVVSGENSQHLTDWYTFSHVLHGILFFALLTVLFPRWSVGVRLLAALAIESGWELFENTDTIINRYREQALAQGYFGDSVVNSTGDMLAALAGFIAAWRLPLWCSFAAIVAIELVMLYFIRDSLILNIIQLIYPLDAIGAWQAAG